MNREEAEQGMSEQPVQPNPIGPPVTGAGYTCKVNADVWATIDRNTDNVFIWTRLNVSTPDDKPIFAPSGHSASSLASSRGFPLKNFKSEEHIGEFVRAVRTRFEANGPLLISVQAALYLDGCVDLQEAGLKKHWDNPDEEMLIGEHLRNTEYTLRLIYDVPRPGTRSKWTAITLSREVRAALAELRLSRLHTLESVAEVLKKKHPDKAPKSGEALRKLLARLKVDWRRLKAEADT